MIKAARFAVVPQSDNPITLSVSSGISEVRFQGIAAPQIDAQSHLVLSFQVELVSGTGVGLRVRLQNAIANTNLLAIELTTASQRCLQEIVAPGVLAADDNELIVRVVGPGSLRVSDFVFWYQADIPVA